jgi:hypothetical protein
MHLNLDFGPQVSDRLADAARNRGIDPATLLESLVTEYLPPVGTTVGVVFPPTGRAAARLRARLAAEATDDPETIRQAQEALDAMKRSMNAERQRSGAEPIF